MLSLPSSRGLSSVANRGPDFRGSLRSVQTTRSKRNLAESNVHSHDSRLDLPEENGSVATDSNAFSTHAHARSQEAVACLSAHKVVVFKFFVMPICRCARPQMSRNKHLLKIYGIRASGILTPPGEPSHRHAVQSDKNVKVANTLFGIVGARRWVGLHMLNMFWRAISDPVPKGGNTNGNGLIVVRSFPGIKSPCRPVLSL